MKRAYIKNTSNSRLLNSEQHLTFVRNKEGYMKYLKTSALVVALSLVMIFSKEMQNILIKEYNKSVAFMQKHGSVVAPLGV